MTAQETKEALLRISEKYGEGIDEKLAAAKANPKKRDVDPVRIASKVDSELSQNPKQGSWDPALSSKIFLDMIVFSFSMKNRMSEDMIALR